jgi:hypothetical protein
VTRHPLAVSTVFATWRDMCLDARAKLGIQGVLTTDFFRWTDKGSGCE